MDLNSTIRQRAGRVRGGEPLPAEPLPAPSTSPSVEDLQDAAATARAELLAALATEAARAAGAKHPEVFARLLTSSSAVTYDDAGLPTNLRALIADIRKESPGFFQPNPHGNADGGARPLAPPPPEDPSRQVDTVIRNAVRRARWADFV